MRHLVRAVLFVGVLGLLQGRKSFESFLFFCPSISQFNMIRKHTEAFTRLRGFLYRGKLYIQLFSFRSFLSRRQLPLWPKSVMKMNCWTTKRRRQKPQLKLRRPKISQRKMWRERTSVSTVLDLEIFFWSRNFYEPSLTVDSNILRKVRAQILAYFKFWKAKFFLCWVVYVFCRLNVYSFPVVSISSKIRSIIS